MDGLARLLRHYFYLIIALGPVTKEYITAQLNFKMADLLKLAEKEQRIYTVSVNIRVCFLSITKLGH